MLQSFSKYEPILPELTVQKMILVLMFLSEQASQLFQASATVCHCLTSFNVKIQLDHFCIGDGSYIDVHKFIFA